MVEDPGFPDEVIVSSGAKEDLDVIPLQGFDGLDGRRGDLVGFVREKGAVDIGEDDFDFVSSVVDAHILSSLDFI